MDEKEGRRYFFSYKDIFLAQPCLCLIAGTTVEFEEDRDSRVEENACPIGTQIRILDPAVYSNERIVSEVAKYDSSKHFGWLKLDCGCRIFFHSNAFQKQDRNSICVGAKVSHIVAPPRDKKHNRVQAVDCVLV